MHEYVMTDRIETDKCLKLANKAHNFYFINPLYYKEEFAKSALDFFQQIEKKFTNRTGLLNVKEAIKKYFGSNTKKAQYISTELFAVEDRLKIIIKNPSLINEKNVFLLDHTARFIEIILPYVCSVKEEVENNRKFSFSNIVDKEFSFFTNNKNDYNHNDKYLEKDSNICKMLLMRIMPMHNLF